MTEVEFHTGVGEPVAFACRLLRKAARQGVRVQVTAPADTLGALDRLLWTFEERDFVPHVRVPGAPVRVARRSPLWLSSELQLQPHDAPRVLVNLGASMPDVGAPVDRLIEIVSAEDAAAGRERWRAYKALGLTIRHHEAMGRAG
jgi:DNA polymerase-3 subunit chi